MRNKAFKVLWFTWKDRTHPQAGGAEIINETIAEQLVKNGNEVIFLVAGHNNAPSEEVINGYKVIRVGSKWTVYYHAYKHYKKNLVGWADVVIDEMNTFPFFAKYYVKEKNIMFVHQLCRRIWFYQMPFPFSVLGYILEPLYLWLLRDREVITVSESSKKNLIDYGFKNKNIYIISESIDIKPLVDIDTVKKYPYPTMLSLGSIRGMKRTVDQFRAYEYAKRSLPNLKLRIAGDASNEYGKKVLKMVEDSNHRNDIDYMGRVTNEQKINLMQKSHVIVVTSVKEGWGLIVTEANSQGTPAIVYDVDGLRDSCKHGNTGLVCKKNTPQNLAQHTVSLLKDKNTYKAMRTNAWKDSYKYTPHRSYKHFINIINHIT